MIGDRSLREYDLEIDDDEVIDDPLVFLPQTDSLIISKEFADRHHLIIGRRLLLETSAGEKAFTIRGIMKPSGQATAFGQSRGHGRLRRAAMLAGYTFMVNLASVFALFIGMFIIHSSFAIAVTDDIRRSVSSVRWVRRADKSGGCSSAGALSWDWADRFSDWSLAS